MKKRIVLFTLSVLIGVVAFLALPKREKSTSHVMSDNTAYAYEVADVDEEDHQVRPLESKGLDDTCGCSKEKAELYEFYSPDDLFEDDAEPVYSSDDESVIDDSGSLCDDVEEVIPFSNTETEEANAPEDDDLIGSAIWYNPETNMIETSDGESWPAELEPNYVIVPDAISIEGDAVTVPEAEEAEPPLEFDTDSSIVLLVKRIPARNLDWYF